MKLAWGRKHIDELEREIAAFLKDPPCESFAETDPNNPERVLQKIRLVRLIPEHFSLIAGDAVDNLRAALDHAVYAVAITAFPGRTEIKHAGFPFAGTAQRFEEKLKGSKDIPKELWPLLHEFQPYRGGNHRLVALNEACNRNKHALLHSVIGIPKITSTNMRATGFISVPVNHVWDREKNEMVLFSEAPGTTRQGSFDFTFLVALPEIVEDEQAFTVLNAFADEVERVLNAIRAESQRLGFCQ